MYLLAMLHISFSNAVHISLQCCTYLSAMFHIYPCKMTHISMQCCTYLRTWLYISPCNIANISYNAAHISLQCCTYLPTMFTYISAILHKSSCNLLDMQCCICLPVILQLCTYLLQCCIYQKIGKITRVHFRPEQGLGLDVPASLGLGLA